MMRRKMLGRMHITGMWIFVVLLLLILSGKHSAEAYSVFSENFNSGNGGFSVINTNIIGTDGPWVYEGSSGSWRTDGCPDCAVPRSTELISPFITILNAGTLTLSFDHRYSFEYDGYTRWDGGQVRISENGGPFIPVLNFTQNGYVETINPGTGPVLNGQLGFTRDSPDYLVSYITSIADLGFFSAGDALQIEFLAGYDWCTSGSIPNWQIDQIQINSTSPVPEPATMLLLGSGLLGLWGARKKFKK